MRPAYPYGSIRRGIGALVSLAVPGTAMFLWPESWWPAAGFVVWTAAAAALYTLLERRKLREQNVRMLDHARQSAIRTLSHHRHDWMNDLQILYGYLRLNKPDKAAEIVDRIRVRMENDSKVSQLGNAELTSFLLSFRTICDHMRLDVQVLDGVNLDRPGLDPDKPAACIIGLINAFRFRAAVHSSGENALRLTLYQTEDTLNVEMVYEGEWPPGHSLAEEAADLLQGIGHWTEEEETGTKPGSARRALVTFPLTA